MQRLKSMVIIGLMLLFAGLAVVAVSSTKTYADAFSSSKSDACAGVSLDGSNGCNNDPTGSGLSGIIKNAINILSLVIGIAAIIMVLVGGFRYVISAGDSAGTNSAKNTIFYALIGLVIAALAQILVHFVLAKVGTAATPPPTSSSSSASAIS
jgi:hypothetical protein